MLGNARGEILVARRFDHAHQGGLWEFPGGKVEAGEAAREALARELDEELGIRLERARPLIRVRHDYADTSVLLDVWWVSAWDGRIHGREGQSLRWMVADALTQLPMPAADVPIVTALRLPDCYLITPAPGTDRQAFLAALRASVAAGVRLVQLRAKALPDVELTSLSREAAEICRAGGARMLVNGDPGLLDASGADGVHLDSARLMSLQSRPVPAGNWLAATPGHPQTVPLGWERFEALVEGVNLPVFALGGMGPEQRAAAWDHGGQGIAAVRALWKGATSSGEPPQPSSR